MPVIKILNMICSYIVQLKNLVIFQKKYPYNFRKIFYSA